MANLSKIKRDRMIEFLEQLKKQHSDDASIRAFNEIENQLRDKKYGLVWEEHSEQVDDTLKENIPVLVADEERRLCKDKSLPWNFIIEGDNLQALYLLEKTHKGKIDCIYIDPPYNTGARDWKYNNDYVDGNDVYRHSKWLSMMKSRLVIAKELLNPEDSVLICTIDEKEYLRLGCLLEELFPNAKIQMITDVINPSGTMRQDEFSRVEEYLMICRLGKSTINKTDKNMLGNDDTSAKSRLWYPFNRSNNARTKSVGQFYPVYIDETKHQIVEIGEPLPIDCHEKDFPTKPGLTSVFPYRENGEESIWGAIPSTARIWKQKGYLRLGEYDKKTGRWSIQYIRSSWQNKLDDGKFGELTYDTNGVLDMDRVLDTDRRVSPKSVWVQKSHNATDYGSNLLKSIFKDGRFTYPKSLYSVHDVINFFVSNKSEATILDFFAGSGTTGHAVNLLNVEDGGNRTWIMVTNNEVSEAETKEFEKQGIKKGDKKWEDKGIAKYVTWPRIVCSIQGVDVNGNPLKGDYFDSNIHMSDGFNANVKYLKCEWTPRKPQDYLLSNALGLHIKEMIELQYAIEIDNEKNVLILNKADFKNVFGDKKTIDQIENIWVNQNIVFNASELKMLKSKQYKYIPKEFFGQELREAAE